MGAIWCQVASVDQRHGLPDGGMCCMLLVHTELHYPKLQWMDIGMTPRDDSPASTLLVVTEQTSERALDHHEGPVSTLVKGTDEIDRIANIIREVKGKVMPILCVCLHANCTD